MRNKQVVLPVKLVLIISCDHLCPLMLKLFCDFNYPSEKKKLRKKRIILKIIKITLVFIAINRENSSIIFGEVAEWSKALVLKTSDG